MWKLRGRDNRIRQWAALGEFQSIEDAAQHVLKLEDDKNGALFSRLCRSHRRQDRRRDFEPPRMSKPKRFLPSGTDSAVKTACGCYTLDKMNHFVESPKNPSAPSGRHLLHRARNKSSTCRPDPDRRSGVGPACCVSPASS